MTDSSPHPLDFIREIVTKDQATGVYGGRVATRFPPEPNGYLHIGHAKSICLNFGIAEEFGGVCHLRFDDTNPETEDMEYVESIIEAVRWLGFDWGPHLYFASDYYEQLYQFAIRLIQDGKAYVDSLSDEQIREYRGTINEPGRASPYRDRSVAENLDLFARMRAGEFPDGAHVLRAKIDMASPNMKLRDPLLYRIRHVSHYRTGDQWCIYPMYDYAHPLSDAIERITHSICTLEFENNRAIYDWLLDQLFPEPRPHQHEFARLELDYTIMSKRKLLQLVEEGYISGWDDPRLPTIFGLRRRGVTPEALRTFADRIGVARVNSRVEYELLEHCIRDDLNYRAPRVMCVLRPLKIVITNYPADRVEELDAPHWPHDVPKQHSRAERVEERAVPFSRELYIEADDFREDPPKGYYRLAPGREVRLRYAYIVKCTDVIKDPATGDILEIHCTYDPATLGANPTDRKVQGTIHWVSAAQALPVEIRLYDRLFVKPDPEETEEGKTFKDYLNPDSLQVIPRALVEPSVAHDPPGSRYQFERLGYFVSDIANSKPGALVYNRTVALRDTWARTEVGEPALSLSKEPALSLSKEPALSLSKEPALSLSKGQRAEGEGARKAATREGAQPAASKVKTERPPAPSVQPPTPTPAPPAAPPPASALTLTPGLPQPVTENLATLEPLIDQLLAAHPEKVAAYRAGKTGLLGFFVGQVMRTAGDQASPQAVNEWVRNKLEQE